MFTKPRRAALVGVALLTLVGAACGTQEADNSSSRSTTTTEARATTEARTTYETMTDWAMSEDGMLAYEWATWTIPKFNELATEAGDYDLVGLQAVAGEMKIEFETTFAGVPDAVRSAPNEQFQIDTIAAYEGYLVAFSSIEDGDLVSAIEEMDAASAHLSDAAMNF